MKNFFIIAISLFMSLNISASDDVKVMTFNVRYDNPGDSLNNWNYRKARVADAINFYAADIVGTQEVLHNQLIDLQQSLPGYAMVGVGRDDGSERGEYEALWYNKARFELIDSGHFWLSQTPDVKGSLGWDGACVRMASWAKLRDKNTGTDYFVLNTHLDHVGKAARYEGVRLILDRVHELAGNMPVIVTGDFNSTPDSDVVTHLTDDSLPYYLRNTREESPLIYGPSWSYHEFGKLRYDDRVLIDYIFIGGPLSVKSYGVLAETNGDGFLSDHCPVLVTLVSE